VGYVTKLVQSGTQLSQKQADRSNVVTTVYEQQRIMFESKTHSVPWRIVSLAQPWVRPIVRGKAHANTEFGAKLHISLVNGYARIERLDFRPYNESEDIGGAIARYRAHYGCYPERILADKSIGTGRRWRFAICLSGPALGKLPKDRNLTRLAKKRKYQDICERNAVEGVLARARPFMAWPASWCACGKSHTASSTLPSCS